MLLDALHRVHSVRGWGTQAAGAGTSGRRRWPIVAPRRRRVAGVAGGAQTRMEQETRATRGKATRASGAGRATAGPGGRRSREGPTQKKFSGVGEVSGEQIKKCDKTQNNVRSETNL